MPHISPVPYEEMSERLQELAHMSDDALGGSDWVRVLAHAPKYYEAFADFYYTHVMADDNGLGIKLTELVRKKVAEHTECEL